MNHTLIDLPSMLVKYNTVTMYYYWHIVTTMVEGHAACWHYLSCYSEMCEISMDNEQSNSHKQDNMCDNVFNSATVLLYT